MEKVEIIKGKFDLRSEFLFPVKLLKSPLSTFENMAQRQNFGKEMMRKKYLLKSRNVFPSLTNESITMAIFSYVDVHHRALDILKRINSKGYDIFSRHAPFKHLFAVFLKS